MPHRSKAASDPPDDAARAAGSSSGGTGAALTPAAFAQQYQANARTFWCIAVAVLGGRSHVDDVLQEAAVIALQKLDQFDPATNFAAWMGQIVRFVALNHGRKHGRTRTGPVDPDLIERSTPSAASDDTSADAVMSNGQVCEEQASFDDRVLTALRSLEDTPRACLLLRTVMEKSYREISLVLDIPEGTAMSHVHRARRAMRELLREEDVMTDETNNTGAQGHVR